VGRSLGDAVGLGWYLLERNGLRFVTHGGSTNGQQAFFAACPEERLAFAVLTNHADGTALTNVLREHVLGRLGIEPPREERLTLSAADLQPYLGAYDSALTRAELTIEDETLVLALTPKGGFPTPESPPGPAPPPTRIAFDAPDAIVALDDPLKGSRGDFLRGPDGEIAWLRVGGRIHSRA
jgi:CubicO group peptidase (beta-lactamase class C family)